MTIRIKVCGPAMPVTGSRFLALIIALAIILALPGFSWAEDKAAAAPGKEQAAAELFKAGDYKAAAAAYEAAYKADPRPEYLYNLGQCHLKVKDLKSLQKAEHALEAYLREKPKAENRAQVEKEIAEVKERIKVLRASRPVGTNALGDILLVPTPAPVEPVPVYKKWWLWTAVGVVVAGAVTTAVVLTLPKDIHLERGTLPPGTEHFD